MNCPFLKKPTPEFEGFTCSKRLHDAVAAMDEMYIPPFMMHLIARPMAHHPLISRPGGISGMVIMEFNQQIFRRDIFVAYADHCPTCGARRDMEDRYTSEIEKAAKAISRDVNMVVKNLLQASLDEVNKRAY